MSRYKWPLIIGVVVLLLLMNMNAPVAVIFAVIALGFAGVAAFDFIRDRQPPPDLLPPRITIGEAPEGALQDARNAPHGWSSRFPPPPPFRPARLTGVPQWIRPAQEFWERIESFIHDKYSSFDKFEKLSEPDPLLTIAQTQMHMVVASALSRHGQIIEKALREALRDNPRFEVWDEPNYKISNRTRDEFHRYPHDNQNERLAMWARWLPDLPYDGTGRTVQVDLIVYDRQTDTIKAFEVKRGAGDAHDTKIVSENMLLVRAQLRDWCARTKRFRPANVYAGAISYYGAHTGFLSKHELNEFFGWDVTSHIEESTAYFRNGLQHVITLVGGGGNGPGPAPTSYPQTPMPDDLPPGTPGARSKSNGANDRRTGDRRASDATHPETVPA
jgi:hypothetical protein